MKKMIAPSLLSADFGRLNEEIDMINNSDADWFHLDVMDGMFVPNISFGFPIIEQVKKQAKKPLDCHLMIVDPDRYIQRFRDAGADIITVHIEACPHLHRSIQLIKSVGAKAGVVLNPHTSISLIENVITDLDVVLLMSVNPGFGGQKFIPQTVQKIKQLRQLIIETNSKAIIQVDGGVDLNNCKELFAAGAEVLVAGNAVFKSENPTQTISLMKL